jgi:hypothetical protein
MGYMSRNASGQAKWPTGQVPSARFAPVEPVSESVPHGDGSLQAFLRTQCPLSKKSQG